MIVEMIVSDSDRLDEVQQGGHQIRNWQASVTQDGLSAVLREIARTPTDILWMDYDLLNPDSTRAVDALRRFRVARSETRIVIAIPEDREAPDALLGACVGLGIWDIVPESLTFPEALNRTPSYADVARWQGSTVSWEEEHPESPVSPSGPIPREPPLRQTVLVASPARPVVILVVGTHLGAGVTTTAVAMANTLSQAGHATVLTEVARTPTYAEYPDPIDADTVSPEPPEPTRPTKPTQHIQSLIGRRQWSYVVVDANVTHWGLAAVSDMVVIIGPGTWYRAWKWEAAAKRLQEARQINPGLVAAAVLHSDDDTVSDTLEWLRTTQWPTPQDGGEPIGLFVQGPEDVWTRVLAPVLPQSSLKRRGWWMPLQHIVREVHTRQVHGQAHRQRQQVIHTASRSGRVSPAAPGRVTTTLAHIPIYGGMLAVLGAPALGSLWILGGLGTALLQPGTHAPQWVRILAQWAVTGRQFVRHLG